MGTEPLHEITLPPIVGITGRKRAGKDTLAGALVSRLGYKQDSFAAPIRKFVADLLGITLADLEVVKEEPIPQLGGKSPRFLMQTLGTEWGRQMIDNDLWVNMLTHRVKEQGSRVVLSDVRFDNEARAIREAGGMIIQVIRGGGVTGDGHVSEAGIAADLIDVTVYNYGTPDDLASSGVLAVTHGTRPAPVEAA